MVKYECAGGMHPAARLRRVPPYGSDHVSSGWRTFQIYAHPERNPV